MGGETELDLVDAVCAGMNQLARRSRSAAGLSSLAAAVVTLTASSALAIASPDSSALTALASRLAACLRNLLRSVAASANWTASSSTRRCRLVSASSETSI